MDECPSREVIESLAGNPAGADALLSAHLESCERCRSRLERARRDSSLLLELRAVASPARRGVDASSLRIPGYTLEAELRRGGQGVVHSAVQEATRRKAAVKLLDGTRSARERRRFEIEIELACRLRHPYIVSVYDSGIAEGVPWFAMELVEGRTLDEWAKETKATLRERLELFARIASGVAYAHRRGVIHRDLKPANILVDAEGKPRILDFGAAIDIDSRRLAPRITAPGEFLGTLAHAAPEQLSGDGAEVDTRTDVYALGLILYELVAGRLPYEISGSVAEIVARVTNESASPPSRFAPEIAADLDAIVLTALDKDPARRFASVDLFEADIENFLAGRAIRARPQTAWYRWKKRLFRHRAAVLVSSAVLLVGASLLVAWLREHQRAKQQSEQAQLVRTVFQDILSAADPQRMGGDVRLLEVFELAARSIEDSLRDAPDAQGAMELTIGDTYRKLLRPADAVLHLRRALERFRAVDAASALDVARCANLLGLALSDQSSKEAVTVQEEALAIRLRELPGEHGLIAESRRSLAIALLSQFTPGAEEMERAKELLALAAERFGSAGGPDDPDLAETKLWQARALSKQDSKQTGDLLAEALRAFEKGTGQDPRLIAALNARAAWAQGNGRFDEARDLLDRSTELTRKLFGDVLGTDVLRRYARLEFARGDAQTAERMSRQAVAHELRRWSERRPEEGARLRALAKRIEEPGPPAAEPPYADAFAALRELEGNGSFELAQWMNGIAMTLVQLDRRSAVEPLLRQALEIHCRAMGNDCPIRQRTIEMLAQELLSEGRGAEALPMLDESLATYTRLEQSQTPEAAHVVELLAACRSGGSAPEATKR